MEGEGEGGGLIERGLINSPPLKRGGLLERGEGLTRRFTVYTQPADWLVSIYFPPKSFDFSLILLVSFLKELLLPTNLQGYA